LGLHVTKIDSPRTLQIGKFPCAFTITPSGADSEGDKAFVDCLLLAKEVGLDAFETACELTLEAGVVTGSIVLNEMRRLTEPTQPKELNACHHLKLKDEPKADFQRYDHLLGAHNVH